MARWTAFPHAGDYAFDAATVRQCWARLHAGDAEPCPAADDLAAAWALFHNGEFQRAAEAGLQAGGAGVTLANKATCIYANYLERSEQARLDLLQAAAARAEAQARAEPENPNAHYWQAYALGRYSQGISVARALAQGLAARIRQALERTIELEPRHADAHVALATFHAEVIDKVGALVGGMTYGAKKETGLRLYRRALQLHPQSVIALVEYAQGLLMLEGSGRLDEVGRLYEQAAALQPLDATERLDQELARAGLAD